MRSISTVKQWLLALCLLAVVICCCGAPSANSVPGRGSVRSSGCAYRLSRTRTRLPDFLDEEQMTDGDDALSDERVHHRKTGPIEKDFERLVLSGLLAGSTALFAYLLAGIFHGSTCPTYGLLRTLTFIFHSDGRKSASLFSRLIY